MEKQARAAIVIIFLINILNYLDRYLLPAVLPKIRHDLGLTFFQSGLLGTSFILVFACTTVPLAILADKTVRKNIISISVIVWSVMTALTGFMQNFMQLFLVRSALGLGEAGYAPASLSILGDYAQEQNRGKVLSLFSAGNLIGAALGYIVGSGIASIFGWRSVFFIVGIPGAILGVLTYHIVEPQKENLVEKVFVRESFSQNIQKLLHIKTYLIVILAYTLIIFAIGGTSFWLPSYLFDAYHLSLGHAGGLTGIMLIVSGSIGVLGGGWISDFLYKHKGYNRLIVPIIGCCGGAVLVLLAFLMHSLITFGIVTFFAGIFLSASSGPLYTVIHDVIPKSIEATGFGISVLLTHIFGDASAPTVIGWFAQKSSLRISLMIITSLFLFTAGLICLLGMSSIASDSINQ